MGFEPPASFNVCIPTRRELVDWAAQDQFRQNLPPVTLFRKQPPTDCMASANEHGTWQHWFEAHGPKLLLCARQWTRSLADAEDVVQEAFVRYWRHQRQLPGDPQALLITSIRRTALDHVRRETRRAAREEKADGGLEEREIFLHLCPVMTRNADGKSRRRSNACPLSSARFSCSKSGANSPSSRSPGRSASRSTPPRHATDTRWPHCARN